ncbi:MAG: sigma-70 family RNA polymerase sigma factor [Gammaproteobacteria bacterium]|nr:sigma-70 family RNA polymerase sigma factor [Gammaproteobacteria bacterium]
MTDQKHQQRFAALWHEHRGIALKVASIYARGSEDRHDLVQDIGMQLWRSFAGFDKRRAKFSTWMYRVALNVAISHVRRRYRSLDEGVEPLDEIHLETVGGGAAIAEPDERLDKLYAVIARLGELDRALMLLYLEDRSYGEMAGILGISETNVATRLSRIKQKLRRQMAGDASTPTGA